MPINLSVGNYFVQSYYNGIFSFANGYITINNGSSDNKTTTVIAALIKQAQQLPTELCKTLTWDRGVEMTNHAVFTVATDIQVYFCDPQSPW